MGQTQAMHRLFAALPVPDHIAERLLPLRSEIFGASWRRRDHFHITLQFYGEVNPEIANEIADRLARIPAQSPSLSLQGVGWFGRKQPRALYARLVQDEALSRLASACRKISVHLGLKLEQDPFLPHITLAYCRDTPVEAAMRWSEAFQTLTSDPFMVDQFHLYESFTGHRRQSTYVAQADFPLT